MEQTSIVMIEEAAKNIAKKITKTILKIQKNKKDIKVLKIPINPEITLDQELDKAVGSALLQGITVVYSANQQTQANNLPQQIKTGDWDIL